MLQFEKKTRADREENYSTTMSGGRIWYVNNSRYVLEHETESRAEADLAAAYVRLWGNGARITRDQGKYQVWGAFFSSVNNRRTPMGNVWMLAREVDKAGGGQASAIRQKFGDPWGSLFPSVNTPRAPLCIVSTLAGDDDKAGHGQESAFRHMFRDPI